MPRDQSGQHFPHTEMTSLRRTCLTRKISLVPKNIDTINMFCNMKNPMKLTYQRNYIQSYIENVLTNIIYVCIISINCSINADYLIFMYHISIAVFDRQFWTTNAFISRIPLCTLNTHLKHMHKRPAYQTNVASGPESRYLSIPLSLSLSLSLSIFDEIDLACRCQRLSSPPHPSRPHLMCTCVRECVVCSVGTFICTYVNMRVRARIWTANVIKVLWYRFNWITMPFYMVMLWHTEI